MKPEHDITEEKPNFASRMASAFITNKLTPLLIIATLIIGLAAVIMTPKEEEPQITVPMIDIIVPYPGADARNVEKTVTEPLEEIIWEIPGVEYVYSTAANDMGVVIVRFNVGMNEEESITNLKMKIDSNMDRMPHGVLPPLIKKESIDDVPQVAITLWSDTLDAFELRRVAAEAQKYLKEVPDVSRTSILGGYKRVLRIEPEMEKLRAYNLDLFSLFKALEASNKSLNTGEIVQNNEVLYITAGGFFKDPDEVRGAVVGAHNGKAVLLKDVAKITDGAEIPSAYTMMGFNEKTSADRYQAVTISLSKRKGSDSVVVAENVLNKLEGLKGYIIPDGVNVTVTKNYGETAYEKVMTLLEHLLGAILAVIIVMTVTMGWRAGTVVFVALPVTFALTLFVYFMLDYTLNRVTLFALIFVTGLVVDDAIIVVENMERHFKMSRKNLLKRAVYAVGEVGNPTILATVTVIVALYPMAFVRGLMGPYMKPMPIGASLAMIFSLFVALIITPWLAYKLLGRQKHSEQEIDEEEYVKSTKLYKFYNRILTPFMHSLSKRLILGLAVLVLFAGAFMFVPAKLVVMKMLPFDNKNEMQIIIDMPEGTPLEQTTLVAAEIGAYLSTVAEVDNYQIYSGTHAPINFNGLVRHYFHRNAPNMADIQVNFVDKDMRKLKSHDLAKKLRTPVQEIANRFGANVKMTEVPPGPPVLSTLVAEIYGPDAETRADIASKVLKVFHDTEGVVDIDTYEEADMRQLGFTVDKEKAALVGVSSEMVSQTLYMALKGMKAGVLHTGTDREDVSIMVQLPEAEKNALNSLQDIHLISTAGVPVALSELVNMRETLKDKAIYHKNMQPVTYITADVAGVEESPVYAILKMKERVAEITSNGTPIKQYWTNSPEFTDTPSIKWDGEWQITYEVFRDLGLAFAAVLVIMYFVLVGWFRSFVTPIIMMIPIPLSLLGIIPGHWLFGEFFTATSMIGFMALAGIMVRNAVLLIDFINHGTANGKSMEDAVIESGAIRTRPVVLTTVTVMVGALFMLPDPIFSGLGVSLITGAFVSTILTLLVIPLAYYRYHRFAERFLK
ncbi:efflux RND transporter permease subunit [Geovibrio thiophilus]|uniref:Efflux RND transporter permease subunit n=1 Tax=Geovibrio thiophilus TaxID=139438 RepID=A0A410JV05_9BACT|nr:efflux RND transporter permease subunit [Geovibrio thiophilus]QAR32003.1 efflux RND transporter permease subunit [Geovibrio thiophilus]